MEVFMKFKRMIAFLLIAVMVMCTASACSSSDTASDSKPETTADEAAAAGNEQEDTSAETAVDTVTPDEPDTIAEPDTTSDTAATQTEQPDAEVTPEAEEPLFTEEELANISIKDAFAKYNVKAGTCMNSFFIDGGANEELILKQFNSITMENHMKPDYIFNKDKSIETGDVVIELNGDAIKMLDWAKSKGMSLRGHTFVWYSQTPQWIFYENFDTKQPKASREVMLQRMESMIKGMFETLDAAGYLDMFYAYDVVNEAVNDDGTLRSMWNLWYETIGEDYIWWAFYYANKYAPEHVDLYYNDYNEQFKTQYIIDLVKTLVDENGNYLIDGIGCQAHLYTMDGIPQYLTHIDKIAELGLKVQLTELDVELGAWQKNIPANEENYNVQGRYVYDLISSLLERVEAGTLKLDAITFWGYNDAMSWRKEKSPCLYYRDLTPKPAFYGAALVKELAGFEDEQQ